MHMAPHCNEHVFLGPTEPSGKLNKIILSWMNFYDREVHMMENHHGWSKCVPTNEHSDQFSERLDGQSAILLRAHFTSWLALPFLSVHSVTIVWALQPAGAHALSATLPHGAVGL